MPRWLSESVHLRVIPGGSLDLNVQVVETRYDVFQRLEQVRFRDDSRTAAGFARIYIRSSRDVAAGQLRTRLR